MSARTRNCARAPVSSSGVASARAAGAAGAGGAATGAANGADGTVARVGGAGGTGNGTTIGRSPCGGTAPANRNRGRGRRRDDDRRRRFRRLGRRAGGGLLGGRRDPGQPHVELAAPQRVENVGDVIEIVVERVEELRRRLRRDLAVEQARLHQVRELAQAHRAGHPRAALERVQRAPQLRGQSFVGGAAPPSAHLLAGLREQFRGLVEEDGQHLRVDVVANVRERVGHRGRAARRRRRARRHRLPAMRGSVAAARGVRRVRAPPGVRPRRRATASHADVGLRRRADGLFLEPRHQRGRGFGVACLGRGFLAQLVQLALDLARLLDVAVRERRLPLDARHEQREPRDRARQHRLRGARQRRAVLLERDQRLLQRLGGRRDDGEAAGAMDAAQRVARAHHARARHRARVELQDRELVLERRDVLVGLVAQDGPERARQRHVADRHVVRLRLGPTRARRRALARARHRAPRRMRVGLRRRSGMPRARTPAPASGAV